MPNNNTFFALGPDGSYFYCTPKQSKRKCPGSLSARIDRPVRDNLPILSGTFGPEKENYFFAWKEDDGRVDYTTSSRTPAVLRDWLRDHPIDEHVRASLGPNNSFFICDSTKIFWHNVPVGFQKGILESLGPCGWKYGPPRLVTFGANGDYCALFEYGEASFSISPPSHPFGKLVAKVDRGELSWSDVEYVSFSASDQDQYLYFSKDRIVFDSNGPEQDEALGECWEDLLDPAEAEEFRRGREKRKQQAKEQREQQERAKQEEERKRQERREKAGLATEYQRWRSQIDADMRNKKTLTTFPHLASWLCTCQLIPCRLRKTDRPLNACSHDVEKLLRASGSYSKVWLKKERTQWHPDQFGRRCDPDFRADLKLKATEMYTIFEELILTAP